MNNIYEFVKDNINSFTDLEIFLQQVNSKTAGLPWNQNIEILGDAILQSLNSIKSIKDAKGVNEELKGIYFCLGDDGYSFCLGCSLYFNEMDWAANAEVYSVADEMNNKILKIALELQSSLGLDETEISDLMFAFSAFTILKVMLSTEAESISEIANVGVALGFCDGDEFIFGYFRNNKFIRDIKVVAGGEYDNSSTVPVFDEPYVAPRGAIWTYLRWNYREFIEQKGLTDQLIKGGEVEAEKISTEFKDHIFVNKVTAR